MLRKADKYLTTKLIEVKGGLTMIDVKKLLYKHKKFVEAKRNAESSLRFLQTEERRHRADENWFIRGSLPSNSVESSFIYEEDTIRRIEIIEKVIAQLTDIIETVERAAQTLDDECKELIQLRYFEGKKPEYVRQKMNLTDTPYYHLQRIALDDMSRCFSTKLWTDDYLDQLLFIPLMDRFKNSLNWKDRKALLQREEEQKISSF